MRTHLLTREQRRRKLERRRAHSLWKGYSGPFFSQTVTFRVILGLSRTPLDSSGELAEVIPSQVVREALQPRQALSVFSARFQLVPVRDSPVRLKVSSFVAHSSSLFGVRKN
jgi:hypothetical protein